MAALQAALEEIGIPLPALTSEHASSLGQLIAAPAMKHFERIAAPETAYWDRRIAALEELEVHRSEAS